MEYRYAVKACNQFVSDMGAAGYEVKHYSGRAFWQGPAVRCDRSAYQDVVRATAVRLQYDSMGMGLIVYPVQRGGLPIPPARPDREVAK